MTTTLKSVVYQVVHLPGSPNLWDVVDTVRCIRQLIDVEKNDVGKSNKGVGCKLIKSKNTMEEEKFHDAVEDEKIDNKKSTMAVLLRLVW